MRHALNLDPEDTRAVVRYVRGDIGRDTNGESSLDAPFKTIQHAVNLSAVGDIIVVLAQPGDVDMGDRGLYRERVVIATPGLTLRGLRERHDKSGTSAPHVNGCVVISAPGVCVEGLAIENLNGPAVAIESLNFTIADATILGDVLVRAGEVAIRRSRFNETALVRLDGSAASVNGVLLEECLIAGVVGIGDVDNAMISVCAFPYSRSLFVDFGHCKPSARGAITGCRFNVTGSLASALRLPGGGGFCVNGNTNAVGDPVEW